jgi:predicted HicB family RNase H-like nuclease
MNYKGYTARVERDDEDGIFFGLLAGIRDSVTFHADNVSDLPAAFHEAVDDYIELCAKIGKEPQTPLRQSDASSSAALGLGASHP